MNSSPENTNSNSNWESTVSISQNIPLSILNLYINKHKDSQPHLTNKGNSACAIGVTDDFIAWPKALLVSPVQRSVLSIKFKCDKVHYYKLQLDKKGTIVRSEITLSFTLSISLIIWRISWSCRKSSPFLKIVCQRKEWNLIMLLIIADLISVLVQPSQLENYILLSNWSIEKRKSKFMF